MKLQRMEVTQYQPSDVSTCTSVLVSKQKRYHKGCFISNSKHDVDSCKKVKESYNIIKVKIQCVEQADCRCRKLHGETKRSEFEVARTQ